MAALLSCQAAARLPSSLAQQSGMFGLRTRERGSGEIAAPRVA